METLADLVIAPKWMIPVQPAGVTLQDHALVIRQGKIVDILPTSAAEARYASVRWQRLPEHVLIPGLVNAHAHAAMCLLRGVADDLPLMEWLQEHIWPLEGQHVSPGFVRDGSLLACAEMLRAGVTCFNDMYFFPKATAEAALERGMRAALGLIVTDFPTPYGDDAADYLNKGLALRSEYLGEDRLSFSLAPHAPYTVSDPSFSRIQTLAEHLDVPIHVHIHETQHEVDESVQQHGVRPLARLHRLGLLGPRLIGVHAVHLNEMELDLLAQHGAHLVHCPISNMKLASGIAPVAQALQRGINVALGTDGAASNNRLDILQEMRQAALLAKVVTGNAAELPAHQALFMATLGGAKALGLDNRIGSLEVGKEADCCALPLSDLAIAPCFQPVSHLLYAAGREHVSHVWVQGQLRVENGQLLLPVKSKLQDIANLWQNRLRLSAN